MNIKEQQMQAGAELLLEKIAKLEAELADMNSSFDLRWKADMRAIKRWQKANPGNDLVWPDHADLCVWLMDQLKTRK